MNGCIEISSSTVLSCNTRVVNLERNLQKSLLDFKELIVDLEKIYIESENYKSQFLTQKEKCESKNCCSAEDLNKVIESKDNVIKLIASHLSKLNETKNFTIIDDIFKILCGETDVKPSPKGSLKKEHLKMDKETTEKDESITEDISFSETLNEIEGTPTGRTSPIIQSKKLKSKGIDNSSDFRDKKKCPDHWVTPEKKSFRLTYPTPTRGKGGGKMRQMRLNYAKVKQTSVVDLTSSPEYSGGVRCNRSDSAGSFEALIIKKESIQNDDTIMPSPTSGPTSFTLFKSTPKDNPGKFKKPLSLKTKKDKENDSKLEFLQVKQEAPGDVTPLDNSVKILNQLPSRLLEDNSSVKPIDNDITHCDNSVSILRHCSPSKRPLEENKNIANVQPKEILESSMSLLRPEPKISKIADVVENIKRKTPEPVEPIYKEPTVRKKSEKRALPGWICEECKNFYSELYEDNPLMLAKMIEECSKHRGRRNPARPKTPPNFWNPRWDVPEDTEELNRMNNAV